MWGIFRRFNVLSTPGLASVEHPDCLLDVLGHGTPHLREALMRQRLHRAGNPQVEPAGKAFPLAIARHHILTWPRK